MDGLKTTVAQGEKEAQLQGVAEFLQNRAAARSGDERCISKAKEIAREILLLTNGQPLRIQSGKVLNECEPALVVDLACHLLIERFARLIRSESRKASRAERRQLYLPGFDHVPADQRYQKNTS